jgi:hypothetical protein
VRATLRGLAGVGTVTAALMVVPATAAAVTCTTPPTAEVRTERTFTPNCTGAGMVTFVVKRQPSHGTLEGVPFSFGQQVRYVADAGYIGPDSFDYAGDGAGGESDVVTQSITVTPTANQVPSCSVNPPGALVRSGTTKTFHVTCVDGDADPVTLVAVDAADRGTASVSGEGSNRFRVDYTATTPTGEDTVSYRASDGRSTSATVAFTANVVAADYNTPPRCQPQTRETGPYFPAGVDTYACTDDESDPITLAVADGPAHGVVTVENAGMLIEYDADDDYVGSDRFTYSASDGRSTAGPWPVDITVRAPEPPKNCRTEVGDFGDGHAYAEETTYLRIACFPGDDGMPLTYTIDAQPQHGTLTPYGQGYNYTPHSGYVGPETFTWHATGPRGLGSGPQQASFDVETQIGNTDPQCVGNGPSGPFDIHADGELTVEYRCSEIQPGDDLAWLVVDAPDHGTLENLDASDDTRPRFTYRPDPAYAGVDEFQVRIVDGRGGRTPVRNYQANVIPPDVNHPPLCGSRSSTNGYALYSCFDPENDPVTLELVQPPAHGTVDFLADASFVYQAHEGFAGHDSFQLRIADDHGSSTVRTFEVHVDEPASAPVPVGGGSGGGSGSVTKPTEEAPDGAPASEESAPSSGGGTPTPPATAPSSARKPAPVALGDAEAFLAPGAGDGIVVATGGRPAPLLVIVCERACTVESQVELLVSGAPRAASASSIRPLKLPVQRLRLRAGRRGTVALRVPAAARRALGKRTLVTARVALTVRHADGRTARDSMTIRVRVRR